MARAANLPTLGLSPFGGGGSSFDAFSIGQAKSEKAYLALRKVEVEWEAGRTTNAAYLEALKTYAATLKANSADRVGADARIEQYTYRFERDVIEAQVKAGTKTAADLLAFDRSKLAGLNTESEEYQQRLSLVNSDQNQLFNDESEKQQELWQDGKITTAQLMRWYQSLDPSLLADNKELQDNVSKTIDNLTDRVTEERDNKTLQDYSQGKMSPTDFLTYATAAQARYTIGTTQYDDWTERIADAKDKSVEDSNLYRYDLTQRYRQLELFVKQNGSAPKGSTSTSTSTRVVWDGSKWVSVTSTSTKAHAPTAAQQAAWKNMQIEVADAKAEMAEIEKKVARQPGGWFTTDDMISYYSGIQSRYAVGSSEWYAVQGKLDGLNQQKHAEAVLSKQGIKITYPKSGSSGGGGTTAKAAGGGATTAAAGGSPSKASGDRTLSIDEFMNAIAKVESGGRYDARNSTTGAYGKYQIMPSSWQGWAGKYLGDKNAKPTPENQEKVARAHMLAMYKKLGDWRAVAHAWLTGNYSKDASTWSASSKKYVDKVFGKMGMAPTAVVKMTPAGTGGGTAAPAAAGGKAAAAPSGTVVKTTVTDPRDGRRNVLDFPRGYDGRAYENFYSSFMDAWKSGQETFVDYSSGRPVAYFIPLDPKERLALAEELDQRRVDYYGTKAQAYMNPDGTPTSTSLAAIRQATGAIVDAAENNLYGLSLSVAKGSQVNKASTTTAGRNDARHSGTDAAVQFDANQQATGPSSVAALANVTQDSSGRTVSDNPVNPLAKGIALAQKLDTQLAQIASAAERAYNSGDFELAYALTQSGARLVLSAKPTIDTYLEQAQARISAVQQLGGTIAGDVSKDFNTLKAQEAQLSGTTGKEPALQKLDEVAGNIKSITRLDQYGEPVRQGPAGKQSFALQDNVTLIYRNGKIEIDRTAAPVGWTNMGTPASGKPMVTLGPVKSGTGPKTGIKSEYQVGVVGFVGGNENYPVYGKIVAGVDASGKQFQWAEDPISGGWYSITSQPLTIKTPKDFQAMVATNGGMAKTGATAMDFAFTDANGNQHRMVFDPKDGKYALYDPPAPGQTDWVPVGKVGGGKNQDLDQLIQSAGWGVDTSLRRGDDRTFSGMAYPVIGYSANDYMTFISGDRQGSSMVGNFGRSGPAKPIVSLVRPNSYKPYEGNPAYYTKTKADALDPYETRVGAAARTPSTPSTNIGTNSGTSQMYAKPVAKPPTSAAAARKAADARKAGTAKAKPRPAAKPPVRKVPTLNPRIVNKAL